MTDIIENRTFDEIKVGDSATLEKELTYRDIKLFAIMSGDVNPAHVDEEYARDSRFQEVIAHGMWGGSLISTVLGTELPGPGTIYISQSLKFMRPIGVGDHVTVKVTVREKIDEQKRLVLDCEVVKDHTDTAIRGVAEVLAPTRKISRPRWAIPDIQVREHHFFDQFMVRAGNLARTHGPLITAVVNPVDKLSLAAVVEAVRQDLIQPILIGPKDKILAIAEEAEIDLANFDIANVNHHMAAANRAVDLAMNTEVDAIVRGTITISDLMSPVVRKNTGLQTGRRMGNAVVFDVPGHEGPLLITDTAVNIRPTLDQKRDIVQNAIDFAITLGIETPRVAILSALETVEPHIKSTLDAAALCKMADRGQIINGLLDGPLTFDNAISMDAATVKNIASEVAGQADILLVPDMETGNMLAKQMNFLGGAGGAGIVLGARVPVLLPGRADNMQTRLVSFALALMLRQQEMG
ncbi:MAG: enoyl-CoA hydratase [Porticoccaceae bacterium]|nr:enoyl-CoA hydratase [Porticoccaceae bacterium]